MLPSGNSSVVPAVKWVPVVLNRPLALRRLMWGSPWTAIKKHSLYFNMNHYIMYIIWWILWKYFQNKRIIVEVIIFKITEADCTADEMFIFILRLLIVLLFKFGDTHLRFRKTAYGFFNGKFLGIFFCMTVSGK